MATPIIHQLTGIMDGHRQDNINQVSGGGGGGGTGKLMQILVINALEWLSNLPCNYEAKMATYTVVCDA